jgi:hypothetical protein
MADRVQARMVHHANRLFWDLSSTAGENSTTMIWNIKMHDYFDDKTMCNSVAFRVRPCSIVVP